MKYLKKYENYNNDDDMILYHGSPIEHNFDNRGDIYNGTFFSTNKNEAKYYGKYLYEIKLKKDLTLFDLNKLTDCEYLFKEFSELYDTYYSEDEDEHYIKSAYELYNNQDSWNCIENTPDVIEFIDGSFDGIWLYEGGVRNLLLFSPINDKIEYIKLIN